MRSGRPTPRSGGRKPELVLLGGLAVLGIVVTGLAFERARSDDQARDGRMAEAVADRLSAGLRSSVASVGGGDGLAVDGEVTEAEFAAFASDLMTSSDFTTLAYSQFVADDDRAAWEEATGHVISDLTPDGTLTPAPRRPRYVAVRFVEPPTPPGSLVLGFDLLGSPPRAGAVEDALAVDAGVLGGPVRLAQTGQPGLFVIHAVQGPNGQPFGFVSSGLAIDRLLARLDGLAHLGSVGLSMDGSQLVAGEGGDEASFDAAGHSFTVVAKDTRGLNPILPLVVATMTLVVLVAAFVAANRVTEDRRRRLRSEERSRQLALLAEALAAADTSAAVAKVLAERAGAVVEASSVMVGRRDLAAPGELVVTSSRAGDPEHTRVPVASPSPLTDCVRLAVPVTMGGRSQLATAYPDLPEEHETFACVPFNLGAEAAAGAIGFEWADRLSRSRLDELMPTTTVLAQMAGRALERVALREVLESRVGQLRDLASLLSHAATTQEIHDLVASRIPPLLDVASATIEPESAEVDPDSPRLGLDALPGLQLVLRLRPRDVWWSTREALARTMADLIGGAWARATRYDEEHSVLLRIQSSLLTSPPSIDGFDIAVAYRSAAETVGIGGDWYSVVDGDREVHLVVGDIAGHGPEAVAVMAEAKTIIRHLLTEGVAVPQMLDQVDAALQRRSTYASVVVVSISKDHATLRYLNAGHPAPILFHDGGHLLLADVHRGWLGTGGATAAPTELPLPAGSTVLLYTDGLVEVRGVALDESIEDLAQRGRVLAGDPTRLVDELLAELAASHDPNKVDDDVAALALRVQPRTTA